MITVRIPTDKNFNYNECKKLFNKYKKLIRDDTKFDEILKNSFFYSFYDENTFIGCIYYYYRNEKLFFNGYANRHLHKQVIDCIKMTFDWFNCDIYAESIQKPAIYSLLRCGFKKHKGNIYIKEK